MLNEVRFVTQRQTSIRKRNINRKKNTLKRWGWGPSWGRGVHEKIVYCVHEAT